VELLSPEGGLFRYRYPLAPERFSARPLEEVKLEVRIEASQPLGSVYSPTHQVTLNRETPTSARASYAETDVLPDRDFILYYSLAGESVGLDFLAHKPPDEDGFFLLLLTPPAEHDLAPLSKDLVLVIDRSGSMEGEKIVQARDAALFILWNLGPDDRFGVIAFDHEILELTAGLVPATPENVEKAVRAISALEARGMTNIHEALLKAMEWLTPADRPQYILFLIDGLPTAGKTETHVIVREVTAANRARARLFAFGVGYNVNTHLPSSLGGAKNWASSQPHPTGREERRGAEAHHY
jgi:Ca-activated chloride channel family protein